MNRELKFRLINTTKKITYAVLLVIWIIPNFFFLSYITIPLIGKYLSDDIEGALFFINIALAISTSYWGALYIEGKLSNRWKRRWVGFCYFGTWLFCLIMLHTVWSSLTLRGIGEGFFIFLYFFSESVCNIIWTFLCWILPIIMWLLVCIFFYKKARRKILMSMVGFSLMVFLTIKFYNITCSTFKWYLERIPSVSIKEKRLKIILQVWRKHIYLKFHRTKRFPIFSYPLCYKYAFPKSTTDLKFPEKDFYGRDILKDHQKNREKIKKSKKISGEKRDIIHIFEKKIQPHHFTDEGNLIYSPLTGEIRINCTHLDSKGVPYCKW